MKKTLFLFAAVLILASFTSCEDDVSYPVNRVEIRDALGRKVAAYKTDGFDVNANIELNAVFLNAKNEAKPVSNPENILWTMSNNENSWFGPENRGYTVYFNPPPGAAGPTVLWMKVEYGGFSYRVDFQLK